MHAVIVPRRSCLIYFLFCQANKFIHSFIHSADKWRNVCSLEYFCTSSVELRIGQNKPTVKVLDAMRGMDGEETRIVGKCFLFADMMHESSINALRTLIMHVPPFRLTRSIKTAGACCIAFAVLPKCLLELPGKSVNVVEAYKVLKTKYTVMGINCYVNVFHCIKF